MSKSYLSISVGADFIKAAQVSSAGKVQKVGFESFAESGDAVTALQTAIVGMNAKASDVLCVIPAEVATTKNIEIPSDDPSEVDSIISLQAGRHTPFAKDEVQIGYVNIGSPNPGHTRVLLVIVKRDVISDKLGILDRAGLNADQVFFVPEGIARFYGKAIKANEPVAIIDVGNSTTNFIIVSNDTVVASRSIPVGIKALIEDGAKARNEIMKEVKTSVDNHKEENVGDVPKRFILTDRHPEVALLEADFKEHGANIETQSFADLVKADKAAQTRLTGDLADYSFLDVVSPAVTAAKNQVDFIPEEVKINKELEFRGKQIIKAGILGLVLFILVAVTLFSKVYFHEQFLNQNLRAKYSGENEQVEKMEKQLLRTRLVREFLETRGHSLSIVKELYQLIPQQVYLTNISLEEKDAVSIAGVSDSMSLVFNLVTTLEESDLFKGVKTRSTAAKKEKGKDVAAFEIVFSIEDSEDQS